MSRVFISLGSNIDPEINLKKAVQVLSHLVKIKCVSTVYKTKAEQRPKQNDYYNCVIEISTDIKPLELKFRVLRGIETLLGRVRGKDKFAPRTIDMDIILYDEKKIKSSALTLPDPQILSRPYLAIPLLELDASLKIPGTGQTIEEIVCKMPAAVLKQSKMKPLKDYTRILRRKDDLILKCR
ncbi:MAG: 2-amino-4-hydroxy-6-hydroxymethyldihydropteridine diphosphokinase [bacterium]